MAKLISGIVLQNSSALSMHFSSLDIIKTIQLKAWVATNSRLNNTIF
jgi:hypothetical protein